MSTPIVGQIMSSYCDCANKESGHSDTQTSWVCKGKAIDQRREESWGRKFYVHDITEFYWECLNCGKKRTIGRWDKNGTFIGD